MIEVSQWLTITIVIVLFIINSLFVYECVIKNNYDKQKDIEKEIALDTIKKLLKALEIVKEKDIDTGWLKRAKDLQEYNKGMGTNSYSALTQEEYDLLKEVFL